MDEKKSYKTPVITVYGKLEAITQSNYHAANHDMNAQGNDMSI